MVRLVNRKFSGRNWVNELKSPGKPFDISKWEVWEAYRQVKANKGAPGVDGCSIEDFESDLKNNLYRVWNRMSSGSYFPPPVKAVEIPKPHGGGVRVLGVPTVADRIAQTVVARRLEAKVEPIFHPDSFGYRPVRTRKSCERAWQIAGVDSSRADAGDCPEWGQPGARGGVAQARRSPGLAVQGRNRSRAGPVRGFPPLRPHSSR